MSEHEQEKTGQKAKHSFLYQFARLVATLIFHTFCPVVYHGREKLPENGPYILVSNHFSNWDPMVTGLAVRQEITFLGKKELVSIPLLRWIFNKLHMIPIDRHHTDMAAMRKCMKALKDGAVLGIFPEGTRHHEGLMENVEDGVALLALRSGTPVIPVLITGKVRAFRVTHVYIGDEIPTADIRAAGVNKETCTQFIERMKERYTEMIKAHETRGQVD